MYVFRVDEYQAVRGGRHHSLASFRRNQAGSGGDARSRKWQPRAVRDSDELHRCDGSAETEDVNQDIGNFRMEKTERLGGVM